MVKVYADRIVVNQGFEDSVIPLDDDLYDDDDAEWWDVEERYVRTDERRLLGRFKAEW